MNLCAFIKHDTAAAITDVCSDPRQDTQLAVCHALCLAPCMNLRAIIKHNTAAAVTDVCSDPRQDTQLADSTQNIVTNYNYNIGDDQQAQSLL